MSGSLASMRNLGVNRGATDWYSAANSIVSRDRASGKQRRCAATPIYAKTSRVACHLAALLYLRRRATPSQRGARSLQGENE